MNPLNQTTSPVSENSVTVGAQASAAHELLAAEQRCAGALRQAQAKHAQAKDSLQALLTPRVEAFLAMLDALDDFEGEDWGERRGLNAYWDTLESWRIEGERLYLTVDHRREYDFEVVLPVALLGDDWEEQLELIRSERLARHEASAQLAAKARELHERTLLADLQKKFG